MSHSDKHVEPSPGVLVFGPRQRQPRPPVALERNVKRTVERPFASIGSDLLTVPEFTANGVVPLSGFGTMIFDSSFEWIEFGGLAMWHTRGRLIGRVAGAAVMRTSRWNSRRGQ